MTSKIFTSNVFLTTSREVFDKFRKSIKVSKFIDEISFQEKQLSFIHYPGKQNSNLIELSYEFGSKQSIDQGVLTLKFLETNTLFENYYLQDSIENLIYRKTTDKNISKKIYFSFGIGDNLENWAGPFEANLTNANLIITESAIKLITLNFMPIDGMALRNKFLSEKSFESRINTSNSTFEPIQAYWEEIVKYSDTANGVIVGNALKKLVTNYIKSITNGTQVIVLLPDISEIYLKEFKKEVIDGSRARLEFLRLTLGVDALFIPSKSKSAKTYPQKLHEIDPSKLLVNFNQFGGGNIRLILRTNSNNTTTIPDPWNPVSKLTDTLKILFLDNQSKTKGFEHLFLTENDYSILSLWKKYKFIEEEIPTVVFGDARLIKNLLYPDDNFQTRSDAIAMPDDYSKFKNDSYKKEYNDLILINTDDFTKDANNVKSKGSFPIFKFNSIYGNVLSLNYKSDPSYFGILGSLNFKEEEITSYKNAKDIQKLLEDFKKLKEIEKTATTKNMQVPNSTSKTQNEIIEQLKQLYTKSPIYDPKVSLDAILNNITYNELGVFVNYFSKMCAEIVSKELIELMKRTCLTLSIRTLPFFKMTKLGAIGSLAYLVGDNSNIFNVVPLDNNSFLTGYYRIMTFKHSITNSDCYSEFTLQRDFGYTNPEIDPNTGNIIPPKEVKDELSKS